MKSSAFLASSVSHATKGTRPAAVLASVIGLYAAGLCCAPTARAVPIGYIVDFSDPYSGPPPTASFDYDPDTQVFSDFLVDLQGVTFDLTDAANNPTLIGSAVPCLNGATSAAASFALLNGACASAPNTSTYWEGYQANAGGTFTFTANYILSIPKVSLTTGEIELNQIGEGSPQAYLQSGTFTISPVPEPNTISLLGSMVALVLFLGTAVPRRLRAAFGRLVKAGHHDMRHA